MYKTWIMEETNRKSVMESVKKLEIPPQTEEQREILRGIISCWKYYIKQDAAKHRTTASANLIYSIAYFLAAWNSNVDIESAFTDRLRIKYDVLRQFAADTPYNVPIDRIAFSYICDWYTGSLLRSYNYPVNKIDYESDEVLEELLNIKDASLNETEKFCLGFHWATFIIGLEYIGMHSVHIQEITYNIQNNTTDVIHYLEESLKTKEVLNRYLRRA